MNKGFLELLEDSLSDFDNLFQEGVIFNPEEIKKLNFLLGEFEKIKKDIFFNDGELNPELKAIVEGVKND